MSDENGVNGRNQEFQVLAFGVALADADLRDRVLALPPVGLHPNQQRWQAAMSLGREYMASELGVAAGDLADGQSIAEWVVSRLESYCDDCQRNHVDKVMNQGLSVGERGRAALQLGIGDG